MIEMRVGYQDIVNGRQVPELHPGAAQALEDEEPAGKIGINDNVVSADLNKKSGMADESKAELIVSSKQRFVKLAGARSESGVADNAPELPHLATNRDVKH